jgi:hypothetical protein
MADQISRLLGKGKPYYDMTKEEFDDLAKEKLKGVKYNTHTTNGDDYGLNAMYMAQLALDRGVPMYAPTGPNLTYSDKQYLDTFDQQPPTNKLFTPAQDVAARADLAARKAMFQNALRGQQAFANPGAGPQYGMDYTQYAPVARNSMLSYLQPYLERFGLYQK